MKAFAMSVSIRWFWLGAALLLAAAGITSCGGGGGGGSSDATTFSKSFGGPGFDVARAAIPTSDGGSVFVGTRDGTLRLPNRVDLDALADGDLWVSKLDANGNLEWQRAIGERSTAGGGRTRRFGVVRQTLDGGYVVAGSAVDPSFASPQSPTGRDVWIARFSAQGSMLWSRDHDSGAWTNFDFAPGSSGRGAFADDTATDVQPTADGGYIVAASSIANLLVGERSAGGFAVPAAGTVARTFIDAQSLLAIKFDADGQLVWQRRLIDGQFSGEFNDRPGSGGGGLSDPRLAAAAEGGALFAHTEGTRGSDGLGPLDYTLHLTRLDANGVVTWQHVDSAIDASARVTDLTQTDDRPQPLVGSRDGQRDDGFLVTLADSRESVALKMTRDGSVEWRHTFRSDDGALIVTTADQACFIAAPSGARVCSFALAGSGGARFTPNGLVLFLGESGTPLAGPVTYSDTTRVADITRNADGTLLAVTVSGRPSSERARLVVIDSASLSVLDRSEEFAFAGDAAFTPEHNLLLTDVRGQRYAKHATTTPPAAPTTRLVQTVDLQPDRARSDAAIGVVEVAPGSYVVAGNSDSFAAESRTEGWVLRITNGTLDWQRRIVGSADSPARLQAVARNAGGVVIAGLFGGEYRAMQLDVADGQARWQSQPLLGGAGDHGFFGIGEMRATFDGGSIVIGRGPDEDAAFRFGALMASRLDAAGNIVWQRRYNIAASLTDAAPADSIAQTDDDGDGARDDGFIVAAVTNDTPGHLITLLKLDANGELVWSRQVASSVSELQTLASNVQVRQGRDGGFVVGTTELGDRAGNVPFGQSNVLLIKLDAAGSFVWSRRYGGLLAERLFGLEVVPDGGLLVAASSDSLGDRSEAWVLRLGADGLLAAGCPADLGSLPAAVFSVAAVSVAQSVPAFTPGAAAPDSMMQPTTAAALDLETVQARQCVGTAAPSEPPPSTTQPVTLIVTQPGTLTGVVTSTPAGIVCGTAAGDAGCSAMFPGGGDVFLSVDPGSVSNFLRWEDCDLVLPAESGAARCRVRMDRSRTVRAVFGQANDRFRLRFTVNGRGTVTSGDNGIRCGQFFGTDQHCEAFYDAFLPGSTLRSSISLSVFTNAADFQGWSGDCALAGTATAFNLTMDGDKTCSATFAGPPSGFDLTVVKSGVGTGTVVSAPPGISCGAACTAPYGIGVTVRLLASEDSGSAFDGWTGCSRLVPSPTGVIPICEVDMGSNRAVGAAFTRMVGNNPLLEFSVIGSDGIVESSDRGISCTSSGPDCQQLYTLGSSVGIGFNLLRSGATFQGWGGDCAFASSALRFNLVMDGNKRCTATFSSGPPPTPPPQVTLTVQKVGFAALVVSTPAGIDCGPTCSAPFASGSVARLAVTPGAGFTLSGWTGCDRQVPGAGGRTDCEVDMTANKTVQVRVE
jgi:hypothetical protein